MIKHFYQVNKNLYRGAEPSISGINNLVKNLKVKKIISLDQESGEKIEELCSKHKLDHLILNINPNNISSLKNLLSYNIKDLINPNIPTFVHCKRGKDRTGLLIALFRCIFDKWDCKKSLKEAKQLGFGTGLNFPIEKFYTKLIQKACCYEHDEDHNYTFDIINNDINNFSIYRDEQLDPYHISFSPFVDTSYKNYPDSFLYLKPYEEQYPNRNNYGLKGINIEDKEDKEDKEYKNVMIPSVGIYDQNNQITNLVGPSLIGGGFVS